MDNVTKLIDQLIDQQQLVKGVVSAPRQKGASTLKVTIRPLTIKGEYLYQFTTFDGRQTRDSNLVPKAAKEKIGLLITAEFKQAMLTTVDADYHLLVGSKGNTTIMKKKGGRPLPLLSHNREKDYLLKEGTVVPFLVELGVMGADGKVLAKKYDKFKQINRFLEMIEDLLPAFEKGQKLTIIDFGCGKSYLTFALYYFLTAKEFQLQVVGLDLKQDVIEKCNQLSKKLGYEGLIFQVGDISRYTATQSIDMVVVLHACDIATDLAIAQAVQWKSKVILAVPCCQHELYDKIENKLLSPLLKHGILKERFAALATDALRALNLEIEGYKTQVLEFIDMEHTPKNLLIRAIKHEGNRDKDKLIEDYNQLKIALNIEKNVHP